MLKFPLIDNLRRYGGSFAAKLADAMAAADPENFNILVQAFPRLVDKYGDMDSVEPEDAIRREINSFRSQLEPIDSRVAALLEGYIAQEIDVRRRLQEKINELTSKLYIIQNNLSKEKIHFSGIEANNGVRFSHIDDFSKHLKSISSAERKPFAEWNTRIYALLFSDGDPERSFVRFMPTPARISELED
ncbi:hypothetical protein UFOVP431_47 [uncultured Caudovirales phage]|uniref:Uncharacterized protein n=1 Tax=uncultured Caudovirales phage TaxID=2100421 RepID=A0A6J5MRR8_9CAUD|nr:hypothetical protein UFOVP431_47 [uncultured Caudovirales phage]